MDPGGQTYTRRIARRRLAGALAVAGLPAWAAASAWAPRRPRPTPWAPRRPRRGRSPRTPSGTTRWPATRASIPGPGGWSHQLVKAVNGPTPWIQTDSYSTPVYVVGRNQRRVHVTLFQGNQARASGYCEREPRGPSPPETDADDGPCRAALRLDRARSKPRRRLLRSGPRGPAQRLRRPPRALRRPVAGADHATVPWRKLKLLKDEPLHGSVAHLSAAVSPRRATGPGSA